MINDEIEVLKLKETDIGLYYWLKKILDKKMVEPERI
jgi:hypothetical protein